MLYEKDKKIFKIFDYFSLRVRESFFCFKDLAVLFNLGLFCVSYLQVLQIRNCDELICRSCCVFVSVTAFQ